MSTALAPILGPPLIPQAHGGALKAGGTPGNKGGVGLPPARLRYHARLKLGRRLNIACKIADNDGEESRDRIAALSFLASVAREPNDRLVIVSPDVVARLTHTLEAVLGHPGIAEDVRASLLSEIEAVWR